MAPIAPRLQRRQRSLLTGLPPQRSFWPSSAGGRRAVLVLDAFRFDLARELEQKLRSAGGHVSVELRPLRASLPSIPPLGMASLLPLDGMEADVSDGERVQQIDKVLVHRVLVRAAATARRTGATPA